MPIQHKPLNVTGCHLYRLPSIVDARGHLTIAELAALPFPVRRVFFISDVSPGQTRGNHARRTCVELVLAVRGSLLVTIEDGARKQDVLLQDRNVGLVIAPKIWSVLSGFSGGAVLAVFASHPHDEADKIRDYAEFQAIASGN